MKNIYTIDIDAPPERVFACLRDGDRAREWIPNLVENEDIDRAPGVVGSTFRHVYVERGRRMEMQGQIVAHEPPRRLAIMLSGPFELHVDYRLDDLGGGRTRLTQQSEVRFKNRAMAFLGALMSPLMKKASLKQAEASFGKLKELVEAA